jgi:hypothetical protein
MIYVSDLARWKTDESEKGGVAMDQVYVLSPMSTHGILHPNLPVSKEANERCVRKMFLEDG